MKRIYLFLLLTAAYAFNTFSQGVIKGSVTSSEGSLPGQQ